MNDRSVIEIQGQDRIKFLQNLVTNDVSTLPQGPVYTAILTPQGKFMADFFLIERGDCILMDIHADLAEGILKRLTMYRLRADVQLRLSDIIVSRGIDTPPDGAISDPRHPDMGWRHYGDSDLSQPNIDWAAQRIAAGVPDYPQDLTTDSYILEMGFERLNGVNFKKGCYVGQEVTARMKHKTELKKGLARFTFDQPAPTSGEIVTADGKTAGYISTAAGTQALGYLRFDRGDDITCNGIAITKTEPLIT